MMSYTSHPLLQERFLGIRKLLLCLAYLGLGAFSTSLVPRPHPLTRRNGLVNQVDFLGLAHTFATM